VAVQLTPKQHAANALMGGDATHILLRGGARSGKTFIIMRAIAIRAIRAKGSRHGCFRSRFNHIKNSIVLDTFPKMMALCFPQVSYKIDKTDWYARLSNGSEIWFGGLDDKDRTEKILGQEYATVFLNECSQISYASRNKLVTRLAQNVGLKLRAYYDANPPNMGHWTYAMFGQGLEPISRAPLSDPSNYATMQINPIDNPNLPSEFLDQLRALPEKERRRFLDGEFLPMVEGALWTYDMLERCRVSSIQLPEMKRIVVAVDPSGCSGPEDTRSDEIGIVAAGLGVDGKGYVLHDASGHYSPQDWARKAIQLTRDYRADRIVAEKNYGGALVEANIRSVDPKAPIKLVTATRGKTVRAEPVANLYDQGMVAHVNEEDLAELEMQMCNFSTAGYQGMKSPDRADSAVWALTELMLGDGYKYQINL
jgi:hypothetical protein